MTNLLTKDLVPVQSVIPSYAYKQWIPSVSYYVTNANIAINPVTTSFVYGVTATNNLIISSNGLNYISVYGQLLLVKNFSTELVTTPGHYATYTMPVSYSITYNLNLGWVSAANSFGNLPTDGNYTFYADAQTTGFVSGFSDINHSSSTDYSEILFGFYVSHGTYYVIEQGTQRTFPANYSETDQFKIERINGVVTYSVNGTVVYTSLVTAYNTFVADTSVYAPGRAVVNAVLTPLTPTASPTPVLRTATATLTLSPLTLMGTSGYLNGYNSGILTLSPLRITSRQSSLTPDFNEAILNLRPLKITAYGYSAPSIYAKPITLSPLQIFGADKVYNAANLTLSPLIIGGALTTDTFKYSNGIVVPMPMINSMATAKSSVSLPAPVINSIAGSKNPFVVKTPLITSIAGKKGILTVAVPTIKSIAGRKGAVFSQSPKISSYTAGLSVIKIGYATISSTAYADYSVNFVGIVVKTPVISSQSAANSAIITQPPVINSWASGLSAIDIMAYLASVSAAIARLAYSMNTTTFESTKYSNFDFIEIIRVGRFFYGVKPTGLFQLGGLTDNGTPIDCFFMTHQTAYVDQNGQYQNQLKRIPQIYLDSETPTTVQPIIDEVPKHAHESRFGGYRTKLGRGYIGKYWQWVVRNKCGKPMCVGYIEALIEVMSRRI